MLNKLRKLPNLALLMLIIWLVSFGAFLVESKLFQTSTESYASAQNIILFITVSTAIFSFIYFIVLEVILFAKRLKKTQLEKGELPKVGVLMASIFMCMVVLTIGGLIYRIDANTNVLGLNISKSSQIPTISPTKVTKPLLIDISVTPYPTSKPVYVDPDPIIKCNVHADCGGGYRNLSSSVCSQSTCCGIGDKWIFYENNTKCNQDQEAYYKSNSPNNNYVPQVYEYNANNDYQTETYYPCTIYYSNQNKYETYDYLYKTKAECDNAQQDIISMEANAEKGTQPDPQPAYDSSSCKSKVISEYEGLMQSCNQYGGSSAYDACIQIYSNERNNALSACN